MQYINTAWTSLASFVRDDTANRVEPARPGQSAIRSVLAHDRLNEPSYWSAYKVFIRIVPPYYEEPTSGQFADYFALKAMRIHYSHLADPVNSVFGVYPGLKEFKPAWQRHQFVAFHYPVDGEDHNIETIVRWDLMTAWELFRQLALTRACLVAIVLQKDYPFEWTAPDPQTLTILEEWAMEARKEFEQLDHYLYYISLFEREGRIPKTRSFEEPFPDLLHYARKSGYQEFSPQIFARLKGLLESKAGLSNRLPPTSAAAGLIRALVQEFRPYQPYGTEPDIFEWWRKRLPHDRRLVKYADRSDLSLDVASRYRREVGGWAFLLGIPESDSAEIVDKSLGGEPGIPQSRSTEKVDGNVRSNFPESDSAGKIDKNLSLGIPASKSAEKVEQILVLGSTKPSIRSKDASMATQKDSLSP